MNNYYRVALGNNYTVEFTSKRDALAFLAETNRFLNGQLYQLSSLYADSFRLYRNAWIYFAHGKSNGLNDVQYICSAKITAIESAFNLAVDRSQWENGNFLVFAQLNFIVDEITALCNNLKRVFEHRGITNSLYEADSFISRANFIKTCIVIFPKTIDITANTMKHTSVLKLAQ